MSRQIMQQALDALMLVGKYTDSLTCYASTISEHEANIVDPSVQSAIQALEAELAKPANEFSPDWDQIKPYYDRIAELESELAKPEQGEVVVSKNHHGQIVAVTRQDEDHHVLKVIATFGKTEQPQTDLRKAAEMALDALEKKYGSWGKGHDILNLNAIVSLRQALIDSDATLINEATKPDKNFCQRCGKRLGDGIHTCTPLEQKPVASIYITVHGEREFDDWRCDLPIGRTELYTAPPKRDVTLISEGKTWQGLTDDEINKLMQTINWRKDWLGSWAYKEFARAIEAKLREKNT